MGGDQNIREIRTALEIAKGHNVKTCVYFGAETVAEVYPIIDLLDYFKIGPYIEKHGGLDSPTTNQRFYKVSEEGIVNQTHLFRKPKINT
jgi:anaerobic ribonucleoside-triphosphate reductase activating protein